MTLTEEEYRACLRTDFSCFVERCFYELNPQATYLGSDYIDLIASRLEACRKREVRQLIINLPPRSLKSHIASVAFSAWLLGHDPATQIICASYGQDLADKHARDSRTLICSPIYCELFPSARLSPEKHAVSDFFTTRQGFRMSTSVGGVLTGRGADFIILDDVLKPEDALSETKRSAVNEWYLNTLLSRLNSKKDGVIIIVMQRLHQDDIVGHLLELEDGWEVLSLPAIAEQDEEYRIEGALNISTFSRRAGEALHPERDSLSTLKQIQQAVGEYNFQSQYQQSPVSREGGLIKMAWIKYYDCSAQPERFSLKLQSWDTANKSGELNDYSVCTTWGLYSQHFYLLDVFRKRLNYPELKSAVQQLWEVHQPNTVLIEDKSSGISLIQELSGDMYGLEPYKPLPGSDKLLRLNAQTIRFENGSVLLQAGAPWIEEYVRELTGFPGTKYDDQVDSTSQALEYLAEKSSGLAIWIKLGQA